MPRDLFADTPPTDLLGAPPSEGSVPATIHPDVPQENQQAPSFGEPGWRPPGTDVGNRITRSMSFGLSDYVGAAGDVLGDKIAHTLGYDKTEPLTYGEALGAIRMANRKFSSEHPAQAIAADTVGMLVSPISQGLTSAAGKIAGLVTEGGKPATAIAPAVRQSLSNMAIQGGIEGTAQGAALSDAVTPKDVAKDARTGFFTGSIASPLMGFIGRAINPTINPDAKYLIDSGVTPKPGQIMGGSAKTAEEKLSSLPIIGSAQAAAQRKAVEDFNVAAYNEALAPIGSTVPGGFKGKPGFQGVQDVRDAISSVYDRAKSNINLDTAALRQDPGFISDMANAGQLSTELTPDKSRQFRNILKNKIVSRLQKPTIDGDTFKSIQTELGDKIDSLRSHTASPDDHSLADALDATLDGFQNVVARLSPGAKSDLDAANAAWARYSRIRRAASSVAAEHGIFTPTQLYSAVKALDRSPGKGDFAMGKSLMQPLASSGKSVLGNSYPDSGSAGRIFGGSFLGGLMRGGAEVATLPALVAGSVPYLPGGRQATATLLTRRPAVAAPISRAIGRAGFPVTTGGLSALLAPKGNLPKQED